MGRLTSVVDTIKKWIGERLYGIQQRRIQGQNLMVIGIILQIAHVSNDGKFVLLDKLLLLNNEAVECRR